MAIEQGNEVEGGVTGKPWTLQEIEAVVETYFHMLRMQESGQSVNKSELNRRLKSRLPARSLAAIAQKHSNISAVLTVLGVQTLRGYWPLFNIQKALTDIVTRALADDAVFDQMALQRVHGMVETPFISDYSCLLVQSPMVPERNKCKSSRLENISYPKRDYLAREASNASIGLAGEHVALEFEKCRLKKVGYPELADRVEHVSITKGDGLGYDIRSFNDDGSSRRIEVKATSYGIHTPIFISSNELAQSKIDPSTFWIYRVFNLRNRPRIYMLSGDMEARLSLEAISYRALPRLPSSSF